MTASKFYLSPQESQYSIQAGSPVFAPSFKDLPALEPGFPISSVEIENLSPNRVLIGFGSLAPNALHSQWDAMVAPFHRRTVVLPEPATAITLAAWSFEEWAASGVPAFYAGPAAWAARGYQIMGRAWDSQQPAADALLVAAPVQTEPATGAGVTVNGSVSASQSGSWSVTQGIGSNFSVIQQSGDVWSVGGAGGGPISISGTITATQGGTWSVAQATGSTFQVIQQSGSVFAVSGSGNFQIINSPGAVINGGAPKVYINTFNPLAGVNSYVVTLDPTYTALTVFSANGTVSRIRKLNGANGWPDWDFNPYPVGQTVIIPLVSARETQCTIEVTVTGGAFVEVNALRGPVAVVPLNYGNQNVQVTAVPGNSTATTGTFFQAGAAWSAQQLLGGAFSANAIKQVSFSVYVFAAGITAATPTQGRSCQLLIGIKGPGTAYVKCLMLNLVPDANGVGTASYNETVLDPFPQGTLSLLGATTGLQWMYVYNTNLVAPTIVMVSNVLQ